MPKDSEYVARINESNIAFKGKIWDVRRESFEFGDQVLTREYVDHPGAVAVVAVNELDQVLLLRQYRHPVRSYLWEIPAGLLDVDGESKADAAQRELQEESGYQAGRLTPLISFFTTPGGNSEEIQIFLAEDLSFVGRPDEQEGEERDLTAEWTTISDAVTSILAGEIKSPTAVVGILALAQARS